VLASAGALDCFNQSRRSLTWTASGAAQSTPDRLPGVATGLNAPALPGTTELERVADDLWAMGLTTEATAMALVRDSLDAMGITRANSLSGVEAPRVSVAGVVTHRQHPETAHGAVFMNLEDETGHVNVVFSVGAWERWKTVAKSSPALVIRGALQRGQGTIALAAEHVEVLMISEVPTSRDWR